MDSLKIIAVGNPGSGKSTVLNSLAGEVLFKAGVNIGQGLTFELDEATNKNGHFLDTPGLADEKLRKAAGKAISDGLRKGGQYKVLFFVTQEAGRVNQQDATTLRLVLEAAPEIGTQYGVIVNKISKPVLEKLKDKKDDFLNTLFAGIPDDKRCVFSNVAFFEKVIELEDRENVWPNPEELKDDSGMSLLQFVHEKIPDVQITSEKVSDVKIDEFEELNKKMEEMAQEMLEKDKKWKEERRKFEEQRAEAARQIEQLKKANKKKWWQKGIWAPIGGAIGMLGGPALAPLIGQAVDQVTTK